MLNFRDSVMNFGRVAKSLTKAESAKDSLKRAVQLISDGCREEGLVLLRSLPLLQPDRIAAVQITVAAASLDPEFCELVVKADALRDARDFSEGEYYYWRCLQLYPLHFGYMVQYGHCLKEQGKYSEAEVVYRSAIALGGPSDDIGRHISFTASMRGAASPILEDAKHAEHPLDLPPTEFDIRVILALLLKRGPTSPQELLDLLSVCPRRRDVVLTLIKRDEFPRMNQELMILLTSVDCVP